MNALKKLVFWGIMFLLCFFQSCKKNGDPCPAEVDFEIYCAYNYYKTLDRLEEPTISKIVCDTITVNSIATFEASDCGASEYEWLIEGETETRKGKKITVLFDLDWITQPTTLNIKLTAKFNDLNNCRNYPNNQKIINKKMCVVLKPAYLGMFYGADIERPDDKYTINIYEKYEISSDGVLVKYYILEGLCPFYNAADIQVGNNYRSFFTYKKYGATSCKNYLIGRDTNCYLDGNTININYFIDYRVNCRNSIIKSGTFVGRKIP